MRALWTGSIGFGLINIPVKLYSAIQDSRLDLDMLERDSGASIKFKRVSEKTGKEVAWENIVKGYLYEDKYVVLEDEDFVAASPEKSKVIQIEAFVQSSDIDGAYFETPYYIEPDKGGERAYQLLQAALQKSKKAGLSRFVLRQHEHLAIIRPKGHYLLLQQLRFEEELRSPEELKIPTEVRVSPKELDVAMELISQYSETFKIEQYKDEYKNELLKIVKAKAGGKTFPKQKTDVPNTRTDDLFDQLKASLSKKAQS